MPKKAINKGSARKIGQSVNRRVARQKTLRGRCIGESADTTTVIGDSIHSIKFKEIPGPVVFFQREGLWQEDSNEVVSLLMLHEDIWEIYTNMSAALRGEKVEPFISDPGINLPLHVSYALRNIRKMIPEQFDFNIEFGDNGHYLVVHEECFMGEGWRVFQIGRVVKKLASQNKRLHDLFLSFLRSFAKATGVDFWWQGFMGSDLEYSRERLLDIEGELDEEQEEQYKEDIACYKNGDAKKYQKLIKKAPLLKQADLLKRATRFKKHPVADIIKLGALLMTGNGISDFSYFPNGEIDGLIFLELDCQANIIWQFDCTVTKDHEDSLDATAQEGVQIPFCSQVIDTTTTKFDFEKLMKQGQWPKQMSEFFDRTNVLITSYERKN
jgi:hypothetical protein